MIAYFARHPTAANLLMVSILFLGWFGMRSIQRHFFPEFQTSTIRVQVVFKGASPAEVEEAICQKIETAIETIDGIKEYRSTASEGLGSVEIRVHDRYDVDDLLEEVKNAVDQITAFPDDAEQPVVWNVDPPSVAIQVALASDSMPFLDLVTLAEQTRREVLQVSDVGSVELEGVPERQIRVRVRRDAMLAHGLTIDAVARRIAESSVDLPSGGIETDLREIKLRILEARRWAEDYRDIPIVTRRDGSQIPLRAIADVDEMLEYDWEISRLNGRRALILTVSKADSGDIIRAADAVREYVRTRQRQLPPGVELLAWNDGSVMVRDRVGMVFRNLQQGVVLVFLTLWLFLNFRLSVWIAAGVGVSFIGTLFLMYVAGLTIDMFTMLSLILALGLVVDDAIVIGENIYAHQQRGVPGLQAAIEGTLEVASGVVSSMLTTVAVLLPMLLLTGEVGRLLRVLPFGVIAALAISLIEGFLILPNHLSHVPRRRRTSWLRSRIDGGLNWLIQQLYRPVLGWCVGHPGISVSAVIGMLIIAVGIYEGRLNYRPMSELDGDVILARVLLPDGTDRRITESVTTRLETAIRAVNEEFKPLQPGRQDLVRLVQTTIGHNLAAGEAGSHVATVSVELLDASTRNARCAEILRRWREEVGEVPDSLDLTYDQLLPVLGGTPIEIHLQGEDFDQLKLASLQLQDKLRSYAGVINLTDDLRQGKQELQIRLKDAARHLGITSSMLAQQLRGAFWGQPALQFQRGMDLLTVEVELARRDRSAAGDLDNFNLITSGGASVPFHVVAEQRSVAGFTRIGRIDGRRTVRVSADIDYAVGNADNLVRDLQAGYLDQLRQQFPGLRVRVAGQHQEAAEISSQFYLGLAVGVVMIYVLLAFVFRSFIEPAIIMIAIPFGAIGAIGGHYLLGFDWTDASQFGVIMLSGIVVNDSIVLVEFIKQRCGEGMDPSEAVIQAGCQRFRAVVLTSLTTAMGLLPLLLERSPQAVVLKPMAVAIAFGILFATGLVLLLVPCLYAVLATWGLGSSSPSHSRSED